MTIATIKISQDHRYNYVSIEGDLSRIKQLKQDYVKNNRNISNDTPDDEFIIRVALTGFIDQMPEDRRESFRLQLIHGISRSKENSNPY